MAGKYVWYACYGSNLNKGRFLYYIKGGTCRYNGKQYDGCTDKREPIKDRPIVIPHRFYFGNESSSWRGGGVAFIDPQQNREERTLGRMYLITDEQFEQVHKQEGSGSHWYGNVLELGGADGFKIKTFTNASIRPAILPDPLYLKVISEGLKETYPELNDAIIEEYLMKRIRADS